MPENLILIFLSIWILCMQVDWYVNKYWFFIFCQSMTSFPSFILKDHTCPSVEMASIYDVITFWFLLDHLPVSCLVQKWHLSLGISNPRSIIKLCDMPLKCDWMSCWDDKDHKRLYGKTNDCHLYDCMLSKWILELWFYHQMLYCEEQYLSETLIWLNSC